MNGALSLLLLIGALTSPGDTLVDVRMGDRLVLEDFGGVVNVGTWDRPTLRAAGRAKDPAAFRVERSGNRVLLSLSGGRAPHEHEEFTLTVPPWMNLSVSGREVEVHVAGLDGDVSLRSLNGDLTLRDLTGVVDAYAAEGEIDASGLTGSARLRTGDDDLTVINSRGVLELETVEGEIFLAGNAASDLSVKTMDGDVDFSGEILRGWNYSFYSHGGNIRIRLMPPVNLEATILSYEGDFHSDFAIRTSGFRSGENLTFVLGQGGSRLVVETFDGDVRLLSGEAGDAFQRFGKTTILDSGEMQ